MKNSKQFAGTLLPTLRHRQTGKTTLMRLGTDNYPGNFTLISSTYKRGVQSIGYSKGSVLILTPENIENIHGTVDPAVLSHEVVEDLLVEIISLHERIEYLQRQLLLTSSREY